MASVPPIKLTLAPIVLLVLVSSALGTLSPLDTNVRSHIVYVLVKGRGKRVGYLLKSLGVFAEGQH